MWSEKSPNKGMYEIEGEGRSQREPGRQPVSPSCCIMGAWEDRLLCWAVGPKALGGGGRGLWKEPKYTCSGTDAAPLWES